MFFLVLVNFISSKLPSPTLPTDLDIYSPFVTLKPIVNVIFALNDIFGQFNQIEFWLGMASGIGAFFARKKSI